MPDAEAILVGVRVRPVVPREIGQDISLFFNGNILTCLDVEGKKKEFQFDVLLDARDKNDPNFGGNEKVYAGFGRRMLDHMLDGFGTCVFAYGQTGTGKSTTIVGLMSPPSEQGLLPRLLNDIFDACDKMRSDGAEVNCKLQMIELYNEQIRDLLAPAVKDKAKAPRPEIHVHPKMGVYITDMQDPVVSTSQECFDLIEYGNNMKTIAATAMNPQSSRGHTIIKFHMERKNADASCTVSDCWIVDLAGRENEKTTQVSGEQFVELSFINRSLMWLAVCIKGLSEQPKGKKKKAAEGAEGEEGGEGKKSGGGGGGMKNLAQFRNSKLTLMLANSLSGNSKTSVVCTASPTMGNYDETLATLKFATSVKSIELKATAATKVDKDQLMNSLQEEVKKLKEQASAAGPSSDEFEELKKRAELAERMAKEQEASWEVLRQQSEEANKLRRETARKMNIMRWTMGKSAIKNLLKSPAMAPGPALPHLVNESDDPETTGKVTFHIADEGKEYKVGHSEECDFKPEGLTEKCPCLCYVYKEGDDMWLRMHVIEESKNRGMSGRSALVLAKLMGIADPTKVVRGHNSQQNEDDVAVPSSASKRHLKVRLNSRLVKGEPVLLKHGDRLTLGPNKKIRFRVRIKQGDFPEPSARELLSVEDELKEYVDNLADVMGEARACNPEMVRSAVKYYSQLRQQSELDEEYEMMLRGFLAKMQEAQTQVNEANNITREMKKGVNLKFELAMEAPPLSFGHGPPQRSFPELVVRKVSDDNRVKSKWRLVRNRLFLISGRDNVDPAQYFRKERAREGKVIVRNIYTAEKFKNQFKVMIGAYAQYEADKKHFDLQEYGDPWDDGDYVATNPEDGGPAEDLNIGGGGGGGGIQDVALVKQKHRDEMKKISEEKELSLAQSSARLRKTEHTLTETQTLTLQRAEEIQNLKEALLEQQELADDDDRKLRYLERERARLLLNNEALEIELEAQRAQVQRNDSDDDDDDDDEFKELTQMVAANSNLLSDLAELRSGTHISYNRVVTATKK
eukprot:CAMPEP_0194551960 /NCGR_PEP_ID=MMETSP0253-20130528/96483_1 /TAXON_ID=2966 /ORGANISM="Noctiluca scintillans" /LENGTH=1024 /DNA_ID=CAMNT_0039399425 /DNA_START=22 /DNA_END=3096 /DNA_ORIENTATION=+